MHNSTTIPGTATFPSDWKFVLVRKGSKAPIGKDWQKRPIGWAEAIKHFGKTYQGSPVGAIGCLAGEVSGGLLFVDCDGSSGFSLLSSWGEVPQTWEVSSGRTGRKQLVFRVGEQFWAELETTKFKTGTKAIDETGKEFEEGLELRWNGCQSLIYGENPVSHKNYTWVNTHLPIAEAPLFLVEKMLKTEKAKGTSSQTSWREFDRSFSLPCQHTIPLPVFLRREDRDLIENGVDSGGRNDTGFKLAANLIATTEYLDAIGQRYDGIPEQLFEQYCQRCHQGDGWTQREWDTVWKSAQKGSKTPACPPDAMEASAKAWVWKNNQAAKSVRPSEVSNRVSKPVSESPDAYIPRFVGVSEQDFKSEIQESLKELNDLNRRRSHRLDLSRLLPHSIARGMLQASEVMPTAPEMLLTALLPIASSLIGTTATMHIDLGYRWFESPVLWTMGVSESGTMKSPCWGIMVDPIKKMQRLADRRYRADKEFYDQSKRAAEKDKQEFDMAEPKPKEYWVDDITIEALAKVHEENPRGLLVYRDEIDGFYAALNKYRSGGDDEQKWLSLNSGAGIKVNRLSKRHSLHKTAIPITGTIQPETIAEHLRGKKRTNSGMNARWLYCLTDMPAPYASNDRRRVDPGFDDRLLKMYKRLASLEPDIKEIQEDDGYSYTLQDPFTYELDSEALEYFRSKWHNPMVARWEKETHPGVKKALSKYRGYCARVALILHLIEWAESSEKYPELEVNLNTLKRAIEITEFYVSQIYLAYGLAGEWDDKADDTNWSALIERLKEASNASEDGWITPRIACRKTSLLKSSAHARSVFAQLYESGIGELDATGAVPRWKWSDTSTMLDAPSFEGFDTPFDIWTDTSDTSTQEQENEPRFDVSDLPMQSREREELPVVPAPRIPAQRPAVEAESSSSRRETDAEVLGRQESPAGEGSYPFSEGDRVVDSVTGQESTVAEVMDDGDGLVLYFLNGSVNDYRTIEQISALQQQPVDIASTLDWKGFQVGDLVECVFPEWMDERSRKESAKMDEAPYGATEVVKELVVWDLEVSSLVVPAAIVEFSFGTQRLALDQLLRHEEF